MGTVCLEERLSVCEKLLIVWRWIYSTQVGGVVIACLLVLSRLCCTVGIVCGLGERASSRKLLWVCSGPSLPFRVHT